MFVQCTGVSYGVKVNSYVFLFSVRLDSDQEDDSCYGPEDHPDSVPLPHVLRPGLVMPYHPAVTRSSLFIASLCPTLEALRMMKLSAHL